MTDDIDNMMDETIDFKRLFATLQRWVWWFAAAALISAGSAFIFSRMQTPVYQATTNVLVTRNTQQSIGDLSQSLNLTQLVETYVRMLTLDEFLGIVSERLGYEVTESVVDVSALTNTQIIELSVMDEDPARAAQIADTMVALLIERNETLQASRYGEAELNLDIQISEAETQIAEIQANLDEAKAGALVEQVTQAQANIDATVETINRTLAELERMDSLTWEAARFQLRTARARLAGQQTLLDSQIAERGVLETRLTEPKALADANYASVIKGQIELLDKKIETTRKQIEELQVDIEFLTPLDTSEGFDAAKVEKQNFLTTQQSLLTSYQNVYTNLLSTEEVKRSTNEIDNLNKDLALYQQIYLNLLKSREDVKTQRMQNTPTVEQVSPAAAGEDPVRPRTLLNTILGGLAGLILAAGAVMVREMADETIKSHEEIEKLLGTKVIGYILEIADEKEGEGIYVSRVPRSPVAEAFRSLRAHLEFSGAEKPLKSILVTSSGPAEGKTTVAANLAAILSHKGKKVVLVDADLRRPRVHQYAGIPNDSGLSDLLDPGSKEHYSDYLIVQKNSPELGILPSGGLPPEPTDLLGSEKMTQLLDKLSNAFDYVVIDSPPMVVSDPQMLSGLVDGVLVVMVPGQTRSDVTRAIREQLEHSGARLLGVVFNRLQHSRRPGHGGYSYYYYPYYYSSNYYYSDDPQGPDGKKGKRRSSSSEGGSGKKDSKSPAPDSDG